MLYEVITIRRGGIFRRNLQSRMKGPAIIGLLILLPAGCASNRAFVDGVAPLTSRQQDAALKALLGEDEYTDYALIADTLEADDWLRKFWVRITSYNVCYTKLLR